jgi:hypothetical protein
MMGVLTAALLPMGILLHQVANAYSTKSQTYSIPNEVFSGPVNAEFESVSRKGAHALDGQKILPRPNDTSFEWWYFDVVSTTSANESVTVIFFETTPDGFPYVDDNTYISAYIFASFEDGTLFSAPAVAAPADHGKGAIVETDGSGYDGSVKGDWIGTGLSFKSSCLKKYTISLNNQEIGAHGTIQFDSVSFPKTRYKKEEKAQHSFP